MTDEKNLEIPPYNPTGWEILIKSSIGMITGLIIAFLVFIMLVLVGGMVSEALSNQIAGTVQINPLLPLILIIIAFVGTFIGSIILSGSYNLIYSEKYYDMARMFALTLVANIILFVLFIGLYLVFAANINELFFVLALHILFTVFVTFAAIEMSTNPNYCAVHLLGASI
ncbi:MAG: hypothetical protein H6765_07250 [Candidatus Peribacteria bacterium]|nr:MAG: hypothetical protein H6765_07250 [Candidatus Peribacteria bacterium]